MAVETLHTSFEKLVSMKPCSGGHLPTIMPLSGVYLFSDSERHLYVGRSRNMRRRYGLHTLPGAQQNQASFAFLLTKEKLGITTASYKPGEMSRLGLSKNPNFIKSFIKSKFDVRNMQFRFVEEDDPTRQALLEIYCAIALATPYNSFKTH